MIDAKLIGLAGKKQVGKDTSAKYLRDIAAPKETKIVAFADPLKESVAAMLGYPSVKIMEDTLGKETPIPQLRGITLRRIYQIIGTEAMRDRAYYDFWVDLMEERIQQWSRSGAYCIIVSDIRFENEAKMVRRLGGSIIHISRNTQKAFRPWWVRWQDSMKKTHRSERGIKVREGDLIIDNSKSMTFLQRELRRVSYLIDL